MKRAEIEAVIAEHPDAVFRVGASRRFSWPGDPVTFVRFEKSGGSGNIRYGRTKGVLKAVMRPVSAGYTDWNDKDEEYWIDSPTRADRTVSWPLGSVTGPEANSFDEWVETQRTEHLRAAEAKATQATKRAHAEAAAKTLAEALNDGNLSVTGDHYGNVIVRIMEPAVAERLAHIVTHSGMRL